MAAEESVRHKRSTAQLRHRPAGWMVEGIIFILCMALFPRTLAASECSLSTAANSAAGVALSGMPHTPVHVLEWTLWAGNMSLPWSGDWKHRVDSPWDILVPVTILYILWSVYRWLSR